MGLIAPGKKSTRKEAAKSLAETARRDDKPAGVTLRLPVKLRDELTEQARVAGDLSQIVLFALAHVDTDNVEVRQTRRAGMELSRPQLLHLGGDARKALEQWASRAAVSINAVVISVLTVFFAELRKSKALREELQLELRARRGA